MQKGFDVVNLHGTASGVIASPYIGENNNWWIGNQDTGISAKGTKGDPGCPGVQGPKGDKGDVGPAGQLGAQGASGPQGLKGDQGDIGPAGPQGVKGDQGLVGNDGSQGSKGDKGDTGPVGPQGPKGEDADVAELDKLKEDVIRIDSDIAFAYIDPSRQRGVALPYTATRNVVVAGSVYLQKGARCKLFANGKLVAAWRNDSGNDIDVSVFLPLKKGVVLTCDGPNTYGLSEF